MVRFMGGSEIRQHFPNTTNFRASRGLDGLQKPKLRTYEEEKSDIGTREMRQKRSDVQWRKREKPETG